MVNGQEPRDGLRAVLEHLPHVMDLLPAGIMLVEGDSSNAKVVWWNTACERLLGAISPAGTSVGELPYAYYRPDRSEPLARSEWPSIRSIATGEPVREPGLRLRRADGEWRVVSATATPLRRDGRVQGALVCLHDITTAPASECEAWLDLTIEATGAGIFHCVPYGPARMSARAREIFGISDDLVDFDALVRLVHPDDRERMKQDHERALEPSGDGRMDGEYRIVRPDGRTRWIAGRGKVQFAELGGATRAVRLAVVTQDVTDRRRHDEALRDSEERYARLAATVPGVLYDFSTFPDGTRQFTYVSPRCAEMLEVDGRDFLADLDRIVHPDDRRALEEASRAATRSRQPLDMELRVTTPSGKSKWVQFMSLPAGRSPQGAELRSGLVLDVTERKRMEEALREAEAGLSLALEATGAGTLHAVPYGPGAISPRFMEMFGLRDPDALPDFEAALRLLHPDDREATRQVVERALQPEVGGYRDHHYRCVWPDGTVRWIASSMKVQFVETDGERRPARLVVVTLDVTDRKREEEALRESEERLRQANEKLREADSQKDRFLAVLSHELRNPLAPIRNCVYLLRRAPLDSEQAARAIGIIERQTKHLTRLVDDLLDTTRISHGKIELKREPLDLRQLVRRTCDDLRTIFDQRGVSLRFEESGPLWVDADATRMAQAVGNLLQNSAKFTPRGGHAWVSLGFEGGRAVIRVRDDGAGMEAADVERMFEPFAQADSSLAHPYGGLGLGLNLVKRLTELHGGSVEGRSEGLGRGCEFTISLPVCVQPTPEEARSASAASHVRRRVLIVEDNVDAGESLAELLRVAGHDVHLAFDGRTGIAEARRLAPDVVLCDIGLPDVDGYEVARTLRADPVLRSTRLVAMTGYAQPDDRERAREAGFDAHIAKPASKDEIEKAIAPAP